MFFFSSNSAPLIIWNRFGGLNRACTREVEETELLASSQEQCWLTCAVTHFWEEKCHLFIHFTSQFNACIFLPFYFSMALFCEAHKCFLGLSYTDLLNFITRASFLDLYWILTLLISSCSSSSYLIYGFRWFFVVVMVPRSWPLLSNLQKSLRSMKKDCIGRRNLL